MLSQAGASAPGSRLLELMFSVIVASACYRKRCILRDLHQIVVPQGLLLSPA